MSVCPFVKTNPTTRYTQPAGLRILSKCIWPFDNPTPDPECGIHNSGMSIVLAIFWQMFWLLVQHQCRVYTIFRHINVHWPKPTQQLLYLESGITIFFECFRSAYVYAKAKYTELPHLRIPPEQWCFANGVYALEGIRNYPTCVYPPGDVHYTGIGC